MKVDFFYVLFLVLCVGFVSAGFDLSGSCESVVSGFDNMESDFVIPNGVPFSDDVFDVYLDDGFFVSFKLVDKKLDGAGCEMSEEVSYMIYVNSSLLDELKDFDGDFVDFYNEKTASDELRIEAVGFGKSVKLGFIKFGLWVAGWFS